MLNILSNLYTVYIVSMSKVIGRDLDKKYAERCINACI